MDITQLMRACKDAGVPWCNDINLRHNGVKDCIDYYDQLIPKLSIKLNVLHKKSYPERFWDILVGPWLIQFIGMMIDRINLIKGSLDYSVCIKSLEPKGQRIIPKTTYESLKLTELNTYNTQLLLDILRIISNEKLEFSETKIDVNRNLSEFSTNVNFGSEKNRKKKILNNISKLFSNKNSIYVTNSTIPINLHFKLFWRLRGFRSIAPLMDDTSAFTNNISTKMRDGLNLKTKVEKTDDLLEPNLELITKILYLYLPVCFLEGFPKISESLRLFPNPPSSIILGTEMYGRYESFCHWVAICAIKGTKIYTMQHGGTYATEKVSDYVCTEVRAYDGFYTWGWKWSKYGVETNKFLPMPSAFLLHKKNYKITNVRGQLLFVVTAIQKQVRRLSGSETDPYLNDKYVQDQISFFKALPKDLQNRLRVRLYKDDLGQNYKGNWERQVPNIKFDNLSQSFDTSLKETAIYISDHLSTTWIEALALNKPTILFIDLSTYNFSPDTWSYLQLLHKVKILHFSPNEAANHLEKVSNDIEVWWSSNKTQNAIRKFLNVMGNCPENSLELWVSELVRIRDSRLK